MKKIFMTSFCVICSVFNTYATPFVWEYYDNTFYSETGGLGPESIPAGGLTGISDIYSKYFFDDKSMFVSQTEWLSDGTGDEYIASYDSNFVYNSLYLAQVAYIKIPESVMYIEDVNNPGTFIAETVPAHIEKAPDWLVDDSMLDAFQNLAGQDIDILIDKILDTELFGDVYKNDFSEIKQDILNDIFSGQDITSIDIYEKLYGFAQQKQNASNTITALQTLQEKIESISEKQNINITNQSDMAAVLQALQEKIDTMNDKLVQMEQKLDLYENILNNYPSLMNNIVPRSASVNTAVARSVNNVVTNQVSVRIGNVMGAAANNTPTSDQVDGADFFNSNYANHFGSGPENDYYEWSLSENVSLWGQGLLNYSKKSGKDAFDADTIGITLGMDKKIGDNKLFGLGYTFSDTGANSTNSDTDITGSLVFLYGEYRPMTSVYVDGILSYGVSTYETKTNLNKSKYDVSNLGLNIKTGIDWENGFGSFIGANYINVNQQGYTDSLGQKIRKNNSSVLTLTLGGQYNKNIWSYLTANLHVNAIYDILTPSAKTNVNIGGIAYQIVGENIPRFGVQPGISFDTSFNTWTFNLGYDFEWRNNFYSHTGRIKIRKPF